MLAVIAAISVLLSDAGRHKATWKILKKRG
jgi:hypothetical protein